MNELIPIGKHNFSGSLKSNHQPLLMSSREVAELCSKRHDHVLRDIDNLNATYAEMGLPKIGESKYISELNGVEYREYLLTHEQCSDLITGYRADVRIRINRRWLELEQAAQQKPQIPQTLSEALRLAADLADEKAALLAEQQRNAPKVAFAEAVSHANDTILIRDLAKVLRQNGVDTGEKRLFARLREQGYLTLQNMPTQRAMDMGLFWVSESVIALPEGDKVRFTTRVTGKGQMYFLSKFRQGAEE